MTLNEFLTDTPASAQLLNANATLGFITAVSCAPNLISAENWLPELWGGLELPPFTEPAEFESYCQLVVNEWNSARSGLLASNWQWPSQCQLDSGLLPNDATQDFCSGFLQGWQLTQDDWINLIEEDSEENALLGGVLLTISLLFDPETATATLEQSEALELSQFEEIYLAVPAMLCGLTHKGLELQESKND